MYEGAKIKDANRSHYKMYQKEAQVISVYSQESQIIVSIPSLLPNFVNISMNEVQNMYYQLRSMRFQNSFYNILVGDTISLKISLGWTPANPPNGNFGDLTQSIMAIPKTVIQIPLALSDRPRQNVIYAPGDLAVMGNNRLFEAGKQEDKCATASELIDLINQVCAEQASQAFIAQALGVAQSTLYQNLIYFVAACTFTFNADNGKMGLQFIAKFPVVAYKDYETLEDLDDAVLADRGMQEYMLNCVFVELSTVGAATPQVEKRLARYFAMDANPGYDPNVQFSPQYYTSFTVARNSLFATNVGMVANNNNAIAAINPAQTNIRTLAQNRAILPSYCQDYVCYARRAMNVNRYDQIYLRTSLNTNHWDNTGRKADIMDIIPITTGMSQLGENHERITRVYQIKDENIQNFTLSFTDADGNLLAFNDPFLMSLAVFFADY